MKSIFLKSFAFSLIALSLWSCKKDETQVVSNISPAGTLASSATTLSLAQSNGANPAVTLTYPLASSSGYVVPVVSTLQFDLKGNNFASAREIVVNKTTYAPTISDLNTMILALGGKVGTPTQVEVRLKSGAAVNALTYSNVITLTATPYLASAWVYVPGAYQGWTPETADSLISLNSNGVYTGMINFTPNNLEFKVTPEKKFNIAYGDAGSGTISTSVGGNLKTPAAGVKFLTVDLNKKTYTITDPLEWSIIGDATPGGWDKDTDMKSINSGKGVYVITTNLTAGEFKFRFQHKWDVNLGGTTAGLTQGGANIAVTVAGNYTITLDSVNNKYTIVKN